MLNTQTNIIHNKVADFSLIWCMQVAAHIKEPQYIPLFEVCTYELVARYFGVTEKRIKNAYNSNRVLFENDCSMVSGRDILPIAIESQKLGKHYGYLMTFANGVKATVSYSTNMVFNGRAILQFAMLLQYESEVAKQIAEALHRMVFLTDGGQYAHKVKPLRAWFLYKENTSSESAGPCDINIKVSITVQ